MILSLFIAQAAVPVEEAQLAELDRRLDVLAMATVKE